MDWGLFEGKYKLRSELIYPHKVSCFCYKKILPLIIIAPLRLGLIRMQKPVQSTKLFIYALVSLPKLMRTPLSLNRLPNVLIILTEEYFADY